MYDRKSCISSYAVKRQMTESLTKAVQSVSPSLEDQIMSEALNKHLKGAGEQRCSDHLISHNQ